MIAPLGQFLKYMKFSPSPALVTNIFLREPKVTFHFFFVDLITYGWRFIMIMIIKIIKYHYVIQFQVESTDGFSAQPLYHT